MSEKLEATEMSRGYENPGTRLVALKHPIAVNEIAFDVRFDPGRSETRKPEKIEKNARQKNKGRIEDGAMP
jgi:hypothetical protein